uniref:Uncharacterized protein n=1 Tax=Panagrolaimus sp. JU765 TaxID=591449 RepID=A0AC34R416_9BILA
MDFLTILMAHEDFETAVLAAKVSIKLCSSEELTNSNTFLIHLLPSLLSRMINAPRKLQKSVSLIEYCNGTFVDDDQVISIVTHLMNLTSTEYSCYNLVLESLNAICSSFLKVYPTAIEFAWNILLGKLEHFNENYDMEAKIQPVFKPSNLLISLILAPDFVRGENAPNLEDFVQNFALKTSLRQQYDIAIQGFRYGHWKTVSLPLLQNIPNGQLSTISSCWLDALKHVASAKPNEVNMKDLSKATFQFSTASIDLESLCPNTEKSLSFQFPSLYTTIFFKITFVLKCFFTFLNGNQGFLLAETDYARYAVVTQCDLMLRDCDKISPLIEELARFSFDADSESRTQVALLQQFHDLIGYCFSYLSVSPFKELPTPFALNTENPMNSQMRDIIAWSRSQLAKMEHSKWQDRVNLANTMLISDVLKELYQSFFYLPRAFFQLIHSTKIRLNVKVANLSKDMSNAYVVSQVHKILPVDVEGFVETNNPAGIQFVNVKAIVTPEKGFSEMP